MSNKSPLPKSAQTIPTGTLALICGIGALILLFSNLAFACLLGIIGLITGMVTLNSHVEKLDKILALIGMILSFIPIVSAVIIVIER